MVCDVSPFWSSPQFSGGPAWELVWSPLRPPNAGVWNTINDIGKGGSTCVLAPPSLAPDEQMMWEST